MKLENLFTTLIVHFTTAGEVKNAHLYDDFATIESVADGKKLKITISCEEDKNGNR